MKARVVAVLPATVQGFASIDKRRIAPTGAPKGFPLALWKPSEGFPTNPRGYFNGTDTLRQRYNETPREKAEVTYDENRNLR